MSTIAKGLGVWVLVAVIIGGFMLPRESEAYCVYNNTSSVIQARAWPNYDLKPYPTNPLFDVLIAPGSQECCDPGNASCNGTSAEKNIEMISLPCAPGEYCQLISSIQGSYPLKNASFACVVPITTTGSAAVMKEWNRDHLGVAQNDLYCESYSNINSGPETYRTPVGVGDTERDVHFLVTGDPQIWAGCPGPIAEAQNVMNRMAQLAFNNSWDIPGLTNERIRGVIVSGDLTQDAKGSEWDSYLYSISTAPPPMTTRGYADFRRFIYDGLGNHDIASNECGDFELSCDYRVRNAIYNDVLRRKRGSVLSTRGHLWDPQEIVGTTQYLSPHYSWDWHDVHFVQLNLMPADFPVEKAANDNPVAEAKPLPPFQALTFLKRDLELLVGNTGRPVVLIHHYGFDNFSTGNSLKEPQLWWSAIQRAAYLDLIKDYNVIAIFVGHTHQDSNDYPRQDISLPNGKVIPTYIAGAARGQGINEDSCTDTSGALKGTYLDVQINNNSMSVTKKDENGVPGFGETINRSPPEIELVGGNPPLNFVNPNTGAVVVKEFTIKNIGGTRLGGTPLKVTSVATGLDTPWISPTANGFLTKSIPFTVPVGAEQIVQVLVEFRQAPQGNSSETLYIQSNDPLLPAGLPITINIDNTASCSAPPPPNLLSPANLGTTFDSTPTFSWQGSPNANEYRIKAISTETSTIAFGPVLTSVTDYTPPGAMANGPYIWTVEGHNNAEGCDVWGLEASRVITIGQPRLYVYTQGLGTVTSNPPGINCGVTCDTAYDPETPVQLQATAFAGTQTAGAFEFSHWSGDENCGSDGNVLVSGTTFCTANFEPVEAILTVEIAGNGKVVSDPPGINCGVDCSESYDFDAGTQVRLTALPEPGWIFAGPECANGTITVDADQTCSAYFRDRSETAKLEVTVNGGSYLTVSEASGAVTSSVPGIDCGSDCVEHYPVGTAVSLQAVAGPGSVFRDWSSGDSTCETGVVGNLFDTQCRANFAPTLLLVDDDDNGPNVLSAYTNALDTLGLPYDVWDTERSDKEPGAPNLGFYTRVIWLSGFADSYAGPGAVGESNLATWLATDKCLFISSQDYRSIRGQTPFMIDYLGLGESVNGANITQVTGTGTVFGGLGPYSLSYPFDNHSDSVSPSAGAQLAFTGNLGNAGIQRDNGIYRTVFLGFPLEALPNPADRVDVLSRFLDYCAISREPAPEEVFLDGFEN